MLRNLKTLENYTIKAADGEIGHVKDFYFDDNTWAVRYFVVDAGTWLSSRKVLISPISIRHPDWLQQTLPASITKQQVKNSPAFETNLPVSRQKEEQYMAYYAYPYYWEGAGLWGEGLYPYALAPGYLGGDINNNERQRELEAYMDYERNRDRSADLHLRSCNAVTGYHIHATDGDIGHVSGFLVDEETWAIRYLVVDTSNWWLGHQVLVAPPWITGVHWSNQKVSISLSRDAIKNAPRYDPAVDWSPDQEVQLYRHYGRSGFWAENAVQENLL